MKYAIIFYLIILVVVPTAIVSAQACTSSVTPTTSLCNGLGATGTIEQLGAKVFTFIGSLVALLAITMLVYSGFRMVTSAGEPEALKTAKSGFFWAVIGFVVSVLSFVIVIAFQNFIGANAGNIVDGQLRNPLNTPDLKTLIQNTLTGFMTLLGILSSLMIVYSSFRYITSAGNEEMAKKAKNGILWSVVGLLLSILAYVIIYALTNLF